MKASVGGRLVGLGDADGLALAVDEAGEDAGVAGAVPEAEPVGAGLVTDGLRLGGAAVPTSSSPLPTNRTTRKPATSTTTTAATALRTQKPRSGSGVPVPGTVCRPTSRRYCLAAPRRRTQPTTPRTSEPSTNTAATAKDTCFSTGVEAAR